jgi:hypothetical protein
MSSKTPGRRVLQFGKAVLPTMLVFLIAGPIAGFVAIFLPVSLTAVPGPLGPIRGLLGMVAMMPIGLPVAYALGYAPALLTGAAVAIMDCVVDPGSYRSVAAILLGALITVGLLHWATGFDLGGNAHEFLPGSAVAAAVGAIAAGVCAWLAPPRVASTPRLDAASE